MRLNAEKSNEVTLQASRVFFGAKAMCCIWVGGVVYAALSTSGPTGLFLLPLGALFLAPLRAQLVLAVTLTARGIVSSEQFAPGDRRLVLERHRLRIERLDRSDPAYPWMVNLGTDLSWYSRPARRRTLSFLADARTRGFEVELREQPEWTRPLVVEFGLKETESEPRDFWGSPKRWPSAGEADRG